MTMNPVPQVTVKADAYVPKRTLPQPAVNEDAAVVSKVARAQAQPLASVHEHNQPAQQTTAEVMADIHRFIQSNQRQFKVSKDSVSGYMVVQVIDPNTGEVIRTLPNDELLRLARSFESLGNTMVHQKA
jgi:flagellar protein FlaG